MERREAVGGVTRDELRVGGEVAPEVVDPAERRVVEAVERRHRGEQRREHGRLTVIEREAHRRDAVLRRRGELGLARHEALDRRRVARLDGCDQVGAIRRSIPQTRSVTSFVNAASRWKVGGIPALRSEKAIVPPSIRTV